MTAMRGGSGQESHEGFLGDLFLNLAAVVIFAIAVMAVERPFRPEARGAPMPTEGLVFHLCGDLISVGDGPAVRADALLGSEFARAAVAAGAEHAPVLRIGAGSDTAAFLLATHLARLGRTDLVFVEGGCRIPPGARP
jgi:hypothetical protein